MTIPCLFDAWPLVESLIERSGPILLGLDFDGTLAPLRSRPDEVILADSVRSTLARLADSRRITVMIVSGRQLCDVADRLGLPGLIYAGNHGLEIEGPSLSFVEPTAAALSHDLRRVSESLRSRLEHIPDVLIESKGLTTSIHYRNVEPEHHEEMALVVREAVATDPDRFVVGSGHCVWEIRPSVAWHKGQAMLAAIQHLGLPFDQRVFFLGDDRTDEDAFASLPDGVTVKIGSPGVPTQARYWLPDPDAVAMFLDRLVALTTS